MKLRNLLEVEYGVHDHLTQFKDAIQNNFGHQQYRDLQTLLSQNKDSEVEDWLKTNGYSKDKKIREYIVESLRNWFKKEDWVRIDTQGNITGPCGTMKKGKATTRCLPRAKANSLTKKQRAATARKKVRGSKKGKQFVKNTSKSKVKLKK
jgi:hypothetical protein|tara:strand:+ start:1629 stop:2078 length:450 start_codon:yes stop_codon:yes gene_type:complete